MAPAWLTFTTLRITSKPQLTVPNALRVSLPFPASVGASPGRGQDSSSISQTWTPLGQALGPTSSLPGTGVAEGRGWLFSSLLSLLEDHQLAGKSELSGASERRAEKNVRVHGARAARPWFSQAGVECGAAEWLLAPWSQHTALGVHFKLWDRKKLVPETRPLSVIFWSLCSLPSFPGLSPKWDLKGPKKRSLANYLLTR